MIGFVPGNGGFELAFRKCIERGNTFFGIDRVPAIARLKTVFADYRPGMTYDTLPLFYEDWDNALSELLMACDDEIQDICRALSGFGLEYVISERAFYNAETPDEMTHAISSEESLRGLTTPSVKAEAAAIKGRGLGGLRKDRIIAGVDIPNINGLMDWYDEIAIVNDKLIISDFGIFDMDTLREFYMQ